MGADRKRELALMEDRRWEEFCGVLARLAPEQMLEPGLAPEWTVKDLLAHLGCWMAETVDVLQQLRFGTWEGWDRDVDEVNAEFYQAQRDAPLSVVRAEWSASRIRMLQEWEALPQIGPDAEEWFLESGPAHHAEHLPDLRRFVERASSQG